MCEQIIFFFFPGLAVGAGVDSLMGVMVVDDRGARVVVGRFVCVEPTGATVSVVVVGTDVRDTTTGMGVGLPGTGVDSADTGAADGMDVSGMGLSDTTGVTDDGGNVDGTTAAIGATVGIKVVPEMGGNVTAENGAGVPELSAAGHRSACGPTCSVWKGKRANESTFPTPAVILYSYVCPQIRTSNAHPLDAPKRRTG